MTRIRGRSFDKFNFDTVRSYAATGAALSLRKVTLTVGTKLHIKALPVE